MPLTQHAKPPVGSRWQYEIKLDGWRGQLHLQRGATTIFSRNGNELTDNCAAIATAAAEGEWC
jgi:bifunctional non-homologous end joining protein LigD